MKRYSTKLFIGIITMSAMQCARAQSSTDSSVSLSDSTKHWSITGYLKDLQSIQFTDIKEKWTLDNLLHNRIDVHYYPNSNLRFHAGIRNRLLYGESAGLYVQNDSLLNDINGFFSLSKTLAKGKSFLLHTNVDRVNADYTNGKWQVTLGKQRINWGLNLVWNPNDIFNAYSYFDFDYEERPGTDAIRVQYYLNSTSSAELAYKPGKAPEEMIAAALYRFTKNSYDIQALAGWVGTDYALGGGWSGVLGQAGFNGEITAFVPHKNFQMSKAVISASTGINYTFPSSLYLHGAYLFNSAGTVNADSSTANFLLNNVSAKKLSPALHSLFSEAAYQFTPLLRGDLAGIIDPADGSFFIGPFFTFSLSNTLELLAGGQLFFGNPQSLYGLYGRILFFRFKWSF